MNSFRSVSSITLICLCWQILGSTASASTSLWGKKLVFMLPRCTWQLQPDVVLPAIKELTVCTLLRRTIDSEWTVQSCQFGCLEKEHSLKWGLKLNEWYSVCVTWSGHARRLQIYINGSSEYEVSLNPLRYQLAPNGTLTLGMSHIIMSGEVKPETGKDLLGEIGRFRMWAREWSAEELGGRSCADGDLVRWDLTQWKSNCFPELDNNLKCAWSHYKIKMWTSMVPSTEPGNCSKSLEEVTQNWLQSIFPDNISVQHIRVSSPSRACRVVNNSAALSTQQPQESRALSNSTCDKCEVNANVDPTAEVEVVQASILSLLNSTFSYDFLNLTAYPNSISILPVAFAPDTFFRVNLTLSMTGSPTKPEEVIEKWLKEQLEVNATMEVLNVIIKENVGRYDCTFNVQEYNINTVAEIIACIHVALTAKYVNNSIIIQTTEVAVKHIVLANCLEENTSTIYGEYIWPEAFPQENQKMGCNKPTLKRAYRLCKLDIETDTTSWADPDMKNCKQLVTISDLDNITVTTGNESELSSSELDTVVDKLREVVHISGTTPAVGANIVNIVANILLSKTDLTPVAGIVLNLTDRMANNMDFPDESVSITAPLLALALINVNRNKFSGLTFGVSSVSPTLNPEIFVNQNFESGPLPDTNATISLPSELYNYFPPGERNTTRIQFQFYASNELFQDPYTNNATQSSWKLNSCIVSASINNSMVRNLTDRVVVTLSHQTATKPGDKVQCMFWDFQKNGGQGGWNSRGCKTRSISDYQTSCLCDHLTHFAVLLDVSRTPIGEADSQILTVISYLGCDTHQPVGCPAGVVHALPPELLALFLLKLRLCIATAATLHYFLLASFTWMGLEAVHMYLALVKVFNIYVPSYILKFCAAGWGIPLVIVSLVLAIDKDAYGSAGPIETAGMLKSTDQFCWLQNDVFFYVTVVAFVLLILFCNVSVFVVVLIQIRHMRTNKRSTSSPNSLQDLRAVASLTVLLGLTWSMGFFSFGPGKVAMMYLFSIFNTLQDWSHSVTMGGKKNHLVNSDSVASDETSTNRKVSDSSTASAPNHHQRA
ncbi:hypothetical protein F7725_010369 [Dissostichus mawsoni]|uniref:Adhesion G-protein coupled receptor G4 n=1 Tax=Dissostichus mawsoni TaxID=36200 RepID=A0A7J5XNR9_DISMA|nr:hypothetical protein F7725_010369 [Dissostichus mawsoni]